MFFLFSEMFISNTSKVFLQIGQKLQIKPAEATSVQATAEKLN